MLFRKKVNELFMWFSRFKTSNWRIRFRASKWPFKGISRCSISSQTKIDSNFAPFATDEQRRNRTKREKIERKKNLIVFVQRRLQDNHRICDSVNQTVANYLPSFGQNSRNSISQESDESTDRTPQNTERKKSPPFFNIISFAILCFFFSSSSFSGDAQPNTTDQLGGGWHF